MMAVGAALFAAIIGVAHIVVGDADVPDDRTYTAEQVQWITNCARDTQVKYCKKRMNDLQDLKVAQ